VLPAGLLVDLLVLGFGVEPFDVLLLDVLLLIDELCFVLLLLFP
jgi:hypothetical protein